MAITYTVMTRIASNPQAALAWAADMASYVRNNFNDTARVLTRVGGPQGVITFASTVDNMAALEEQLAKIQDDAGYWERVNKALEGGFVNAAVTETAIWSDIA
jgi:hypothetical protein